MNAMRAALPTILFIASWGTVGGAEQPSQIASRLAGTKPVDIRRESIPPDSYGDVIAILRSQSVAGSGAATRVLLCLGDEETIQTEVQYFVETEGTDWGRMRALRGTPSLGLIAALGPLTLRDEEIRYHNPQNPEFRGSWGVSYESAEMIRRKLIETPEIPSAVSAWARTIPTTIDVAPGVSATQEMLHQLFLKQRDTIRQWWVENREHFEKGEIDQLQPLASTGQATTATVVTTKRNEPQAAAPPQAPAPARPHAADLSATAASEGMGLCTWWLWAGGAVVVVALGWIVWRAR